MAYVCKLPDNAKQASEVIFNLMTDSRNGRNRQAVRWWINYFYLQGVREFSNLNYLNGTVGISYLNESGILNFKYNGITSLYQSQLGRLMALDLSPSVRRKGISLDGMRKASTGQVVLDAAFPQDKVKELALSLHPPLLQFGTVGVGLWIEGEDSIGIEVINPWEILPIPSEVASPSEIRGLIRVRRVPKSWIQGLAITPSSGSKAYKEIDSIELPTGKIPTSIDLTGEGVLAANAMGGGFYVHAPEGDGSGKRKKKDETKENVTQLIEVWTKTSDGYLGEYAIFAGIKKLSRLYTYDHTQSKYPMPIRVIRDITTGGFWGQCYIDQLIPLNHEVEIALSSLFQAVSDFDSYGMQLWPASLGVNPQAMRGQDGIKRIMYEPDYSCPELKPENIMPAKMTKPQVDAVNLAVALMNNIANQPVDLMRGDAPGRVDSSTGLGFLYEVSGIPLSPTAKNIAEGVSGIYRAMLRILKDIWTDKKVVSVSNLDDSLAGIVLDTEAGTLSLSQNSIPFPDEVSVTIASEVPISAEKTKMELKEALGDKRITLEEYSFEVRKRGLDLPVGLELEWQNYRRAMLENLILFGDGETPGKVITSDNDVHRIHLNVLMAFTARPEFYAASVAVRNAFFDHIRDHQIGQGDYPDQLPMMEDIAGQSLEQMPPMGPLA